MNIIVIVILERGDCVCGLHLYIHTEDTHHTIVFALIERIFILIHFRMHMNIIFDYFVMGVVLVIVLV